MAQDLKSLIAQAQKSVKSTKGPGHVTAMRGLLKRIRTELGEEAVINLTPAAFLQVFKAVHPDKVQYLKDNEHSNVLRRYKLALGYKYNQDLGKWVKA